MNLLLVDDEEYMIESIKKNVDWKDFGIDAVYTAFSVKQAQMIMEMADVDVIISDIVMPQESGFDLIEWVRSKGYRMSVIFLTSYAEFDYARRAIALDSVEYLLKPVDFGKLSCAGSGTSHSSAGSSGGRCSPGAYRRNRLSRSRSARTGIT